MPVPIRFGKRPKAFSAQPYPSASRQRGKGRGGGCASCATSLLRLAVADGHVDMAALLADAGAAPLGARREPAQRGSLLDENARHAQLVDVGAVVVLRVRDGRLQRLADQ